MACIGLIAGARSGELTVQAAPAKKGRERPRPEDPADILARADEVIE